MRIVAKIRSVVFFLILAGGLSVFSIARAAGTAEAEKKVTDGNSLLSSEAQQAEALDERVALDGQGFPVIWKGARIQRGPVQGTFGTSKIPFGGMKGTAGPLNIIKPSSEVPEEELAEPPPDTMDSEAVRQKPKEQKAKVLVG